MSSAILHQVLGCLEYVDIEGKRVPFGTDILFICEGGAGACGSCRDLRGIYG